LGAIRLKPELQTPPVALAKELEFGVPASARSRFSFGFVSEKNLFDSLVPGHRNTRIPSGKRCFPVLPGAVIWVCFEKQTHMISGRKTGPPPALAVHGGDCPPITARLQDGASSRWAAIGSAGVRRFDAALHSAGQSEQSVKFVDCFRERQTTPLAALAVSGGTLRARTTLRFMVAGEYR
jgi:hypothetical protein